jgi:hypothetical protein
MSRILKKTEEGTVSILLFEMRGLSSNENKQNDEYCLIVF